MIPSYLRKLAFHVAGHYAKNIQWAESWGWPFTIVLFWAKMSIGFSNNYFKIKEITSDVTLMDTSPCHVQYSCLSSCICDILLPVGSQSVILSQEFARFSQVSLECLLGLGFPRSKNDEEEGSVQKEKLCFAAVPLILEEIWNQKASWDGLYFQAGCESHRFTHILKDISPLVLR